MAYGHLRGVSRWVTPSAYVLLFIRSCQCPVQVTAQQIQIYLTLQSAIKPIGVLADLLHYS